MYQNIFEPFACSFELNSDDIFAIQKWEIALLYFMTIVTELTAKEDGAVIGHIKMIAELDETSFIKLNAIRFDLPVEVNHFGDAKGSAAVRISFNSLVYHIPAKRNFEIVSLAVARTLNAFSLHTDFSLEYIEKKHDHNHEGHDDGHDHKGHGHIH